MRPAPAPTRADATARATGPVPVESFTDPAVLAPVLVGAERVIRREGSSDAQVASAAHAQQQAYRDLVQHPGWQDRVRAQVPDELLEAYDANLLATGELRRLTDPRDALPDWRIIEPPPQDELLGYYRAAEEEFGVGWEYLAAIHLVESRMGRIRGLSTAGARGPMQFLPATWDAYGEGDIDDPGDAIRAAARYLVAHGAPGDMPGALWAYNHSDRYVDAVGAHAGVMRADPAAYRGYYHWRVYYRLATGDVILEVGYDAPGS